MDTKEVTIQLLKDLYASDGGLLPYTLYKRYGVTPIALVQIVKRLQEKDYLTIEQDNRMLLTADGREKAEGLISNLSKPERNKIDSQFFISIASNILDKKKPFLPSMQFFEQYNKEGEENG